MSASKKALSGNDQQRARPNPVEGCPLTAALAAIGGKWKLIIVYWLAESPKHFAALRKAIPGISQKVLTQQLRELMSDGIVTREPKALCPRPLSIHFRITGDPFCPWLRTFACGVESIYPDRQANKISVPCRFLLLPFDLAVEGQIRN